MPADTIAAHHGQAPDLPAPLRPLTTIARNLWWTWNADAVALLRRLDPDKWEALNHDPLAVINQLSSPRLAALAHDEAFCADVAGVAADLESYLAGAADPLQVPGGPTAYFSAEFGLHQSVPIYAGGLGVLSGDHLKAASDLGLPLVAVGLAYRYGYVHQRLDAAGTQTEHDHRNDFSHMPLAVMTGAGGEPLLVDVPMPGRTVWTRILRLQVGRVPLFLLDADIPENDPVDRGTTAQLYGGDDDMRIRQELLLGVGGVRALAAMGVAPAVCHLNEGHSAFLNLERMRPLIASGMDVAGAAAAVRETSVFTTHTPVAAGNDVFPLDHVRFYMDALAPHVGVEAADLLPFGVVDRPDEKDRFNMTVLALRLSCRANGVSELHGRVSRRMWHRLWPELVEDAVPIGHVTNGVHLPSWTDPRLADRAPAALWRAHEELRAELVSFARGRNGDRLIRVGATGSEVREARAALDPSVLTIGFARRFAAYKRALLLFSDPDRLARLLGDTDRPLQLIFAGKAHPANEVGKGLIREVVRLSTVAPFRGRLIFLEDYDLNVARRMVRGVDVWLNNPRRPLEASGTSGMKAAANGVLNLSVADGWWCEGYRGDNGWVIGKEQDYADREQQDSEDAESLYHLLENEVVPLFYDRDERNLPQGWIGKMIAAMDVANEGFGTDRMVADYQRMMYAPCRGAGTGG